MIDFLLSEDLDIEFKSNGDYVTTDDIETAIITALFSDSDRNWMLDKDKEGSYLYLAYQTRITSSLLKDIRFYVSQALSFLIDDNLVSKLDVEVKVITLSTVEINMKVIKLNGELRNYSYYV